MNITPGSRPTIPATQASAAAHPLRACAFPRGGSIDIPPSPLTGHFTPISASSVRGYAVASKTPSDARIDFPATSAGLECSRMPEQGREISVAVSVIGFGDRDLSRRAGPASAGPSDARTQGGSRNGVTGTDRGRRDEKCARRRQSGAATMGAVAPHDPRGHRTPEMGAHRIHRGPAPEASSRGALPRTASRLRSLHSTNARRESCRQRKRIVGRRSCKWNWHSQTGRSGLGGAVK